MYTVYLPQLLSSTNRVKAQHLIIALLSYSGIATLVIL